MEAWQDRNIAKHRELGKAKGILCGCKHLANRANRKIELILRYNPSLFLYDQVDLEIEKKEAKKPAPAAAKTKKKAPKSPEHIEDSD